MTEHSDVFLSYSRNDRAAAVTLRGQLERCGLSVFHDVESIRASDLWLDRLQEAVGGCGTFVVLVGRDGVRRWIGAETQVALNRHFAPHDDALRLPIFPILLEGTEAETLPAFLRLFQMTPWNGAADALPERLLDDIRERTIVADRTAAFEGCPFVGLAAYRIDQAHLFFGRQKETLDALACFFDIRPGNPPVRWLEINGNSGSGKSSLMQAGLLPLVDKGWLWRPHTGYERWQRIGPMMPGERPVEMLAESLARAWKVEMADVSGRLQSDRDAALVHWLRTRKEDGAAFLLAIDQFEELFTFADADERRRFDRLVASALEDADCPLFVISTVRSVFLTVDQVHPAAALAGSSGPLLTDGDQSQRTLGVAVPGSFTGQPVEESSAGLATTGNGDRLVEGHPAAGVPPPLLVHLNKTEQQLQRPIPLRPAQAVQQIIGTAT